MNPQTYQQLADQHMADVRQQAASSREHIGSHRAWPQALRERTGWTLVDLGLRLVAEPPPRNRVPRPRPAGS